MDNKKKIIDDRGRLFGKISVIDVIVIVIVVVLAVAVYVKYDVLDKTNSAVKTTPITYTAVVSQVRQPSAALFRDGDEIYTNTGIDMGQITNITTAPSQVSTSILDGTYVMANVDGRYDVTLTIVAPCSESNGRYYINKTYELRVNTDQQMVTKYNAVTVTIIGMDTSAVTENG